MTKGQGRHMSGTTNEAKDGYIKDELEHTEVLYGDARATWTRFLYLG